MPKSSGAANWAPRGRPGNDNTMAMRGFVTEDTTTTASKYPFYVELDSTDGLILGQHVYLTLDTGRWL